jgi:hypothetical protein
MRGIEMIITCTNAEQFFNVIEELTRRGLTFTADYDRLIITLTGGF